MSEQLDEKLTPFKTIIYSLVSYAMHPKLDTLIEKLTPDERPALRFLIKVEIKRLSKPCPYTLDFRSYFEECEPVQHLNICHYLDEISKTLFLESIEQNNGLFSLNIYNEINDHAKQRHLEAEKQRSDNKVHTKIDIEPVKTFNLINNNICYDQPLNIFSRCKVFTYDPLGMSRKGKLDIGISATVLDLNPQNCVLKTPFGRLTDDTKIIYLWFYDHDNQLDFYDDIVLQYDIEERKSIQEETYTHYRLKLNKVSDTNMVKLFTDLLMKITSVQKELLKNQIQPLSDSIFAKSHEQFLLNTTQDIPLLCAPYQSGWRPTCGLQTSSNTALWAFFSSQSHNDPLTRLFCSENIQQALKAGENFSQYAYVLRHNYQIKIADKLVEKEQFIVIWQEQLQHNEAAVQLLKEFILNGDYRYVHLQFKKINALSDAYNPSAVPSHVNPAMALLNRPLTEQSASLLKASNYFALLADVSEINTILALDKRVASKERLYSTDAPISCDKVFQLPQLQRKSPMEVVRVEENDFRAEDRFDLELKINVTRCGKVACNIEGKTQNISTQGLSVILSKELKYNAGENIVLTLEIPYKNKLVTLTKQGYQIIGGSNAKHLRLLINTTQTRHAASWMLREYIYQHMDSLKPSGFSAKQTYGLESALRNIVAKNHSSIPFFIQQDKRQWFINSVAINKNNSITSLALEDKNADKVLINLIEQEKFRDYCLSVINKIDKKSPVEVFYILTLPRNPKSAEKQAFWFNDIKQLQQAGHLNEVLEKITLLGKPTILRVKLAKPHRIMDKYFYDELNYLGQISARKAQELSSTIEQVAGIGEITDHTEQMLALIERWLKATVPLKLADVS